MIPKGYECQWQQQGYLRKFSVISEHPEEAMPASPTVEGIVKPHSNAPQAAFNGQDWFALNAAHAEQKVVQKNDVAYTNENGKFTSGTFDSNAFSSEAQGLPINQFVYVLKGAVTLTDEQGVEHRFTENDAFFIPQGTVCAWKTSDYLRFNYATLAN